MMQGKKTGLGILLLLALMAVTGGILLKGQPISILLANLKHLNPWLLLPGLAMMFGYVGCEAACTRQILSHLGHRTSLRHCLGYSFVGFYVSSVTPSATGAEYDADCFLLSDGGIALGCRGMAVSSFGPGGSGGRIGLVSAVRCGHNAAADVWNGSIYVSAGTCTKDLSRAAQNTGAHENPARPGSGGKQAG